MIQVTLHAPTKVEQMDDEIIALAGCDLGFIMPGQPPNVLQVEPGSEMGLNNIRTDDVLVGVNGRDTRGMGKDALEQLLRAATSLTFERPKADADAEMAFAASEGAGKDVQGDVAEAAAALAAASTVAPKQDAPPAAGAAAAAAASPFGAASGSAAGAAAWGPQFRTGMQVCLVGFQNPTVNGAKGRLGKFSEKLGSWQVFLENATAGKAVRPANLEPLPGSDWTHTGGELVDGAGAAGIPVPAPAGPPMLSKSMVQALGGVVPSSALPPFDGPGPPCSPEWQEDTLPCDTDGQSFVEFLRDAHFRQLRADAEHPEPPPFHRAHHFGAVQVPGRPLPDGKYPTQALNFQLQLLMKKRNGDGPMMGMHFGAPYGPPPFWMPGRRMCGKGFGGPMGGHRFVGYHHGGGGYGGPFKSYGGRQQHQHQTGSTAGAAAASAAAAARGLVVPPPAGGAGGGATAAPGSPAAAAATAA